MLPLRGKRLLERIAERVLTAEEAKELTKGLDVIGDIAVLRIPEGLRPKRFDIARALLEEEKRIRTVLGQSSPVSGDYRLRGLEWLAGEKRTHTIHKEHGCLFKIDLAKAYFSPRLSHERLRVAELVSESGEVVLNMFAGVGCYSIIIAKRRPKSRVYSVDINPEAVLLHLENIRMNKLRGRVIAGLGDSREIARLLAGRCDRVIMPLPERAIEFLDSAVSALRGRGFINYYCFSHGKGEGAAVDGARARLAERLDSIGCDYEILNAKVVRETGPNWYQIAFDLMAEKRSAQGA
ncbi:MAG: class I SAM-dependent methyltransferase family protein [Candidatus Bathyarchaeia archaeon]